MTVDPIAVAVRVAQALDALGIAHTIGGSGGTSDPDRAQPGQESRQSTGATGNDRTPHEDSSRTQVDFVERICMITCMRTTLVIDDEVLRQARKRAAERNLTVSDIVNEALREAFARPRPAPPPFSMITYGRSGRRVSHTPEDFAAAFDREDMERLR